MLHFRTTGSSNTRQKWCTMTLHTGTYISNMLKIFLTLPDIWACLFPKNGSNRHLEFWKKNILKHLEKFRKAILICIKIWTWYLNQSQCITSQQNLNMAARGMLNFTGIAVMRDRCSTSAHRIWFTYLFRRLGSMYGKRWTTHGDCFGNYIPSKKISRRSDLPVWSFSYCKFLTGLAWKCIFMPLLRFLMI